MCLQYKFFENTVGKGKIAHDKQLLLSSLPPVFSTRFRTFFHFHKFEIIVCKLFQFGRV